MGIATLPYVWVARELVPAAYLNADFNAILNQVNGNLDATNLANLAVTTAKIALGAVTGPKIAMGSDAQGDILFYDGTKYARLAAGTSGQALVTGGAGANPAWQTPNGNWLNVGSGIVTTLANFSPIPTAGWVAGAKYKLILNLAQVSADGYIVLNFNTDTGANYEYQLTGIYSGATGYVVSVNDTKMYLHNFNNVVVTGGKFWEEITLIPSAASNNITLVLGKGGYETSGGGNNVVLTNFMGKYNGAAAITALKITTSAGTMTGTWQLYQLA